MNSPALDVRRLLLLANDVQRDVVKTEHPQQHADAATQQHKTQRARQSTESIGHYYFLRILLLIAGFSKDVSLSYI